MKCPSCQIEAPSDAEFCPNCGAALLVPCPQCRTLNSAGSRFCKKCGQALGASRPAAESERFATPNDVVNHYNKHFSLGLTDE